MNFETAFEILSKHEGGFVNHADDPGGATKYGITEAVARQEGYRGSMIDLPIETAKKIAERKYWLAVRAPELPGLIRYPVFDAAYHSGPIKSIIFVQKALKEKPDGIIGAKTIAAINSANIEELRIKIISERLRFLSTLVSWPNFSRGWVRRIANLLDMQETSVS